MTLTHTDQARLAKIRRQAEIWLALDPRAREWDSVFLLRLLDMKSKEQE